MKFKKAALRPIVFHTSLAFGLPADLAAMNV